ncbi:MAG TPA: DUF2059 domain-containing protein [Telluria sp.]|nr:DUF2059 domain-containing protein [Telluria sp.]
MKIKTIAAAALTAIAFAAPMAQAQTPAPKPVAVDQKTVSAVKDMLAAMNYRQTMQQMNEQMLAQMPQLILGSATQAIQSSPNMSEEKRKEALTEVHAKMPEILKAVREVMEDPKLIDAMIDAMPALYARHFTTAEIVEMGKFYRTPLGAKTLKVMPVLMAESTALGQQIVLPRMQAVMQRFAQPAK